MAVPAPVIQTGAGNVTTVTQASGSTITVNKPSNTTHGDLLVAFIYMQTDGTFSAVPTGWTAFSPDPHTTGASSAEKRCTKAFYKYIKFAGDETATSYAWTGAGGRGAAILFRVTGASETAPEDSFGAVATNSGTTTQNIPAVTTVAQNTLLLAFVYSNTSSGGAANPDWTPPGGVTELSQLSVGTSPAASSSEVEVGYQTLSSTGSTGVRAYTASTLPTNASGFMVAIAPRITTPVESNSTEKWKVRSVVESNSIEKWKVRSPVESNSEEKWIVQAADTGPLLQPRAETGVGDITSVTVTSSSSITVNKPANTSDGDLLVALIYTRNSGVTFTSLPADWLPFTPSVVANGTLRAFYKYIPSAAAETASSYTWISGNGAARGLGIIFRVTNTSSVGAQDSYGSISVFTGFANIVLPSVTTNDTNTLLVAFSQTNNSNTNLPGYTLPGSMTEVFYNSITASGVTSVIEVAQEVLSSAGATGTRTLSFSPNASNSSGFMVALTTNGTTPPGTLTSVCVGAPTADGATVRIDTQGAAAVRLAVSASADMSSPTYTSSEVPDSNGIKQFTLTGIGASVTRYYQAEVDGTLQGGVGRFKTLPVIGTQSSFSFAAGSCSTTNSNSTVFQKIRETTGPFSSNKALFFAHIGDFHYDPRTAANDLTLPLSAYRSAFAQAQPSQTYREIPLIYTTSDHDYFASNIDSTAVALPSVNSMIRTFFPNYTLPAPDGKGLYRSWVVGRVHFIMTDGRTYMDAITKTDDASKTKLGAAQKAWFKTEIQTAKLANRIVVWFHEDAWSNGAHSSGDSISQTFPGDDTWEAYSTERKEIVDFCHGLNVVPYIIHGDLHVLAADTGVHTPGNFPVAVISPLQQTSFLGNGIYSQGQYPTTDNSSTWEQFGWFDVTDSGNTITIDYKGIDSSGTTRITMSTVYSIVTPTGRLRYNDAGTWKPVIVKDNSTGKEILWYNNSGTGWKLLL